MIVLSTNSRIISTTLWARPGTSFAREAMMHMTIRTTARTISRTSWTRLNSNQVPSKRIASGKNSSMLGVWKFRPPIPPSARTGGVTSAVFSSISRGLHTGAHAGWPSVLGCRYNGRTGTVHSLHVSASG
jgi:hypothetical protein